MIDNAVKYTPDGGTVVVRVSVDDHRICVAVRDSGIGIAENELAKYSTGSIAQIKRGNGTPEDRPGSVDSPSIAEAHRAEIRVQSKLNVGSEFCVCFLDPIHLIRD